MITQLIKSHTNTTQKKIMKIQLFLVPAILSLLSMTSQADEAAGKMAYMTCSACHNADGKGLPLGEMKMAPSLEGSKIVNGDASLLALVILKGIKKEGTEYMGMMAALELAYPDDQKLADVMTYVRQSFGNSAAAVTAEDAAKYRAQWQDIKEPVSRAKLAELLATE